MKQAVILMTLIALLAGCVQLSNTSVVVKKYSGSCSDGGFPCCKAYVQDNADIVIDGKAFQTDSQGRVSLKLDSADNHTIEYRSCTGEIETLLVEETGQGYKYSKVFAYQNAEYENKTITHKSNIEINLPCCTA